MIGPEVTRMADRKSDPKPDAEERRDFDDSRWQGMPGIITKRGAPYTRMQEIADVLRAWHNSPKGTPFPITKDYKWKTPPMDIPDDIPPGDPIIVHADGSVTSAVNRDEVRGKRSAKRKR